MGVVAGICVGVGVGVGERQVVVAVALEALDVRVARDPAARRRRRPWRSASGLSSPGWRSSGSSSSGMDTSVYSLSGVSVMPRVYRCRGGRATPRRVRSDEREPLLAAGQLLVPTAYGVAQRLPRVGPLGGGERVVDGHAAGGQVADRLGDDADLVALLLDELAVDRRRRDRARRRTEPWSGRARCRGVSGHSIG